MSTWNAGYVSDVAYVRHFIDELTPNKLRLVAATAGLVPPPIDDFDYCELGCAHGDTTAALAAAYPKARFLGVDIGAEHVVSARKLARDGALENVGFLESDFEALIADETIGPFDYVTAHGLWSWISPAKRQALREFARAKLKPGGLFFVSYNAMPGWGAVEPLRQLLLSPLGAPSGANEPSIERARRGFTFAETMAAAGAEYFKRNPATTDMLTTMAKVGLPYVVHEYLHEHWAPMYFARVAYEMSESDLHFAGVLPTFLNFRDAAIPEAVELVLKDTDRITFESLKDFALNEFFRRDVYVKGRTSRSPTALDAVLDETPWQVQTPDLPPSGFMKLPHRQLKLEAPIFAPLYAALQEGQESLETLRSTRPELAGWPPDQLRAAILRLALSELVMPASHATKAVAVDAAARFTIPLTYNQMMVRKVASEVPLVLATVAGGTGMRSSALEVLAMRFLTETRGAEREARVGEFVGKHELRLAIDGKLVQDRADQKKAILEAIATLTRERLGKYVELGIMHPAP